MRLLLTILLTLSYLNSSVAQDRRFDQHGDPLPEGATARLGSNRFCHPGAELLQFSEKGGILASASSRMVCLWRIPTGQLIRTINLQSDLNGIGPVTEDGKVIVVQGQQATRFNVDGKQDQVWMYEVPPVVSGLSVDGKLTIGWKNYRTVSIFAQDGAIVQTIDVGFARRSRRTSLHGFEVVSSQACLTVSPDGSQLVHRDEQGFVLIDLNDTTINKRLIKDEFDRHDFLTFTHDGAVAGTERSGKRIWVRDLKTNRKITSRHFQSLIRAIASSPDRKTIAAVDAEGSIQFLNRRDLQDRSQSAPNHLGLVRMVTLTGKADRVITLAADGRVRIWDRQGRLRPSEFTEFFSTLRLWNLTDGTRRMLATGFDVKNGIRVGDFDTRKWLWQSPGSQAEISQDGRHVVIVDGQVVRLQDATTGHLIRHFEAIREPITGVAASVDGWVVCQMADNSLLIRDAKTGATAVRLEHHSRTPTFSPLGWWLASPTNPASLREAATGSIALTFADKTFTPVCMRFSPDGRRLVGGDAHGTIRLWDLATGRLELTRKGHHGAVTDLAISNDGKTLASGGADSTVLLWDLELPEELPPLPDDVDLAAEWEHLRATNARRAFKAMQLLTRGGDRTVKLIATHANTTIEPRELLKLIDELDSKVFKIRERAEAELLTLGPEANLIVEFALRKDGSPEKKRRLERLARKLRDQRYSYLEIRLMRACVVLRQIGTEAALALAAEIDPRTR